MYRITTSLTPDGLSFSAGSWLWVLWCLFPPLRFTSSGKLRELLRRWGYCFWIHMLPFVYHTRRGAGWPLWFWGLHHWPFMSLVAERLLVGGAAKVFWLRNVSKFRQNLTRFVKASLKIALSVRAAILVSNFPSLAWGWVSNLLRRRRRRRQGGEKPRWPPVMSRRSYGK